MSENNETNNPVDEQVFISLKGRASSGEYKLIALTQDEILAEVKKLGTLNEKILATCLDLADKYTYEEPDKLRIALAFFNVLSVSSYTVLRSRLEKDLHER